MCGLFGCWTDDAADIDVVELTARLAGTRGPQAFGFAWRPAISAEVRTFRQRGQIAQHLDTLDQIRHAQSYIGQARLATSGSYRNNDNNQPVVAGDLALAHNGNVYNVGELERAHRLHRLTDCDSEILPLLAQSFCGPTAYRIRDAVRLADRRSPLALMAITNRDFVVARRAHPLYVDRIGPSWYFCSRKFGSARLLPDNAVVAFPSERVVSL